MKKYEYKFVKNSGIKLGFDYDKKVGDMEKEWNSLGENGWQFCRDGNGFTIFIREIDE